mmetsp:Transcript_15102/g.22248  ORF Transcript_15102/g.22248 Transcript_15102/m.22248 type:complete len:446 (-) Transcript_15102:4431-5768(-)
MTAAQPDTSETTVVKASSTTSEVQKNALVFSPELLSMYYSRLFPFEIMYDWMSYNPSKKDSVRLFSRREFSFTIEIDREEIYIRYQSFSKQEEFRAAILQRKPMKIDIGAVFSHPPKDHKAIGQGFKTEQRELVFDIDLTDYDEVRQCGCSGAQICMKCWQMMTMAVKVMDCGLREDFGFKHIAWFYSGRRGVHAWVCDEEARKLSNEARSAVANYFEISLVAEKNKPSSVTNPLHPMMKRAVETLEPMFIKHVLPSTGQSLLAEEEKWVELLGTLPDCAERVRENLEKNWKKAESTPSEKWEELKKHLEVFTAKARGGGKSQKTISSSERSKLEAWPVETVFRSTYPRLDINVSKMQNHLLKSPFCVHPKTGRVCVPISVESVDSFDPFNVPTLPELMHELDNFDKNNPGVEVEHEWEKTSLKETFKPFTKEFLEPMWNDLCTK